MTVLGAHIFPLGQAFGTLGSQSSPRLWAATQSLGVMHATSVATFIGPLVTQHTWSGWPRAAQSAVSSQGMESDGDGQPPAAMHAFVLAPLQQT